MSCLNFTLYLNSTFPRNLWRRDIRNLTKLCEQFNLGHYSIEIVHLADEPRRGFHDGVFTTPTILLEQGDGRRQILGNLAETEQHLSLLQLSALATELTGSPIVCRIEAKAPATIAELILGNPFFGGSIAR